MTQPGTGTAAPAITVVEREPAVVVGIPVTGTFADLGRLVPAAWRRLSDALDGTGPEELAEVSVDLGDGHYHETVGRLTRVDDRDSRWPAAAVHTLVPGGRWAQTSHDGPSGTIAETFGRLLEWVTQQGASAGPHKLDVGYRLDGGTESHVLAVQLR